MQSSECYGTLVRVQNCAGIVKFHFKDFEGHILKLEIKIQLAKQNALRQMKEVYLHRVDFKLLQPVTSRISGMTSGMIDWMQ